MEDHIDLIKGQPVFDQALVAVKGPAETFINIPTSATTPTSILSNQMHGTVKVGNGHQGFNAILMALLKGLHGTVDLLHSALVHLLWKDPRPGDGQTIGFKAHFPKRAQCLPVAMGTYQCHPLAG